MCLAVVCVETGFSQIQSQIIHLLSLSIMVTVALSLLVTPLGSEDLSTVRLNVSDSS